MRTNYPLLSKELNDIFQDLYYKLVFLLGYADGDEKKTYQGIYDDLDSKIYTLTNASILQDSEGDNPQLVYKAPALASPIPVYSTWGQYIIINDLRRL